MWIAVAILSLIAVFFLLLCVPLDVMLRVDSYGKVKFHMRLVWLFGLLTREFRRPQLKRIKIEQAQRSRRALDLRLVFDILRIRGLFRQTLRLFRDLVKQLEFRAFEVDLKVGFDNPADTGLLFGLIGPAMIFLSPEHSERVRLEPSYISAAFEGHAQGTLRVRPIRFIPSVTRFLFSPPVRQAGKKLISSRWKRKS